uniref:Uncharacterized protein n=1 Tax=Tanacetum cinerariifolium TaxID=118510 RepID=A0A6L2JUM4_TANCI|nr:hypothetical protein [Tanacetum cinerariifolium]
MTRGFGKYKLIVLHVTFSATSAAADGGGGGFWRPEKFSDGGVVAENVFRHGYAVSSLMDTAYCGNALGGLIVQIWVGQALKGLKRSCGDFGIAKSWITCVNINRNTTLISSKPHREGLGGLCMADSHTGKHLEDDFMPLETIQRSNSTIRKKIPFELEGEAFVLERRALEDCKSAGYLRMITINRSVVLEEFQQTEFKGYGPKTSNSVSENTYNEVKESIDAPLNLAPRVVLMKTGLRPLNTARPVNSAYPKPTIYSARPMLHFSKSSQLTYEEIDCVYVAFGGEPKGGKIIGEGGLTYLFENATLDESNLWHKRLGHINFKTMKKLVRGNLVRDHLGKFDGKADDGYFVGYSMNSKAFNLFDIDTLTKSMNYKLVVTWNQSNGSVGKARVETEEEKKDAKDLGNEDNEVLVYGYDDDLNMPNLEEINYSDDDKDVVAEADMTNLDSNIPISPILTTRIYKDNLVEQIIRAIHSVPQTRKMTKNVTNYEPRRGPLEQKWFYKNKKDERGIVIRNKASLVAQGYTQEEGIYYDEVFAPIDRIEVIRQLKKEIYVCQPLGFKDVEFPDRVYKVEKALYGLHQVPRAWYETLSTYLLDNGFHRGQIDMTLFIKSFKGELTFFLGLQVHRKRCRRLEWFSLKVVLEQVTQKDDGIFIGQDKYVDEILKKFGFSTMKIASKLTTAIDVNAVEDEAVYKEMYDSMERAATTTGLDAEQDRGIIRVLDDEEVVAEKEVSTADPVTTAGEVVTTAGVKVSTNATTPIISMDDITLAKALVALKSAKRMVKEPSVPKAKGIVMQEPEETAIRTTTTTVPSQGSKDKGKATMIEPKKPLKNKYQIMIDKEVARDLEPQIQAELEEEERLARQKEEEANIALIAE